MKDNLIKKIIYWDNPNIKEKKYRPYFLIKEDKENFYCLKGKSIADIRISYIVEFSYNINGILDILSFLKGEPKLLINTNEIVDFFGMKMVNNSISLSDYYLDRITIFCEKRRVDPNYKFVHYIGNDENFEYWFAHFKQTKVLQDKLKNNEEISEGQIAKLNSQHIEKDLRYIISSIYYDLHQLEKIPKNKVTKIINGLWEIE